MDSKAECKDLWAVASQNLQAQLGKHDKSNPFRGRFGLNEHSENICLPWREALWKNKSNLEVFRRGCQRGPTAHYSPRIPLHAQEEGRQEAGGQHIRVGWWPHNRRHDWKLFVSGNTSGHMPLHLRGSFKARKLCRICSVLAQISKGAT